MGGLSGGPSLYLRDFGHASLVPGGGACPSFRALVWVEGGRVEGWVRLCDGYPTGGGAGPSARGDAYPTGEGGAGPSARGDAHPTGASWVIGCLQEDGEAMAEVLCFGPSGQGAVIGSPVLSCYFCTSPLYRHGGLAFLCLCGQGFVLGVCGDPATGTDMNSRAASLCVHDPKNVVGSSAASVVRVGGGAATARAPARGAGLVRVGGDTKNSGAAPARPPARGRGLGGPAGARAGRGRGRTPEGEGRQAKRSAAKAATSYKPPPAEEEESESSLAVRPPEAVGVNQEDDSVTGNNDKLSFCYTEMVSIFHSVKNYALIQNDIQADADQRRDWSSLAGRLRGLRSRLDGLLSRYDELSDTVQTLRSRIRTDGGYPVEAPPILDTHPRSLAYSRK